MANKNNVKIAALMPQYDRDPFWQLPLDGIRKAHNYIKNFGIKVDIYHYKDGVEKDLLNVELKILKKIMRVYLLLQ